MPFRENLDRSILTIDYRFLLPAMARMPLTLGEYLCRLRGLILGVFDYEWRSVAIGHRYIRGSTLRAMEMIRQDSRKRQRVWAALKRFMFNSREHWEGCLFESAVMSRIARNSSVQGMETLLAHQRKGRGIVMVSCHFDGFLLGIVLFGMNGLRTNLLTSTVIDDPRVHPDVSLHFNRKFRAIESLTGGRCVHHELDRSFFPKALRNGETVVTLGDVPGSKSNVFIPFLGTRLRMPLGAWQMARSTGSLIGAFVCLHRKPGHYRIYCLTPGEVDPDGPLQTLAPIYAFLENWIRRYPERWFAADLLPSYGAAQ